MFTNLQALRITSRRSSCGQVNVALALERPLLIKGEPGTSKTLLAEAVSEALGRPLPYLARQEHQ